MKIAVTYDNGNIFQHFGHTQQFKIYDINDGKVKNTTILNSGENGHGALAGLLMHEGIDTLICGGIGGGAQQGLANAGIKLFGGVTGDADKAVEALLNDTLEYNPDITCNHHGDGGHSHNCGGSGGTCHS